MERKVEIKVDHMVDVFKELLDMAAKAEEKLQEAYAGNLDLYPHMEVLDAFYVLCSKAGIPRQGSPTTNERN